MGGEDKVALNLTSNIRVSDERHSKFGNFPKWIESNGRRYEVVGVDKNGQLRYTDITGSSIKLDPGNDFRKVIEEGIQHGIFSGNASAENNPYGTVLRCELIFELWVSEGAPKVSELPAEYEEEVSSIVGEEAYYRDALRWLYSVGEENISELYTYRDFEGPITWLEYSYIIFVVLKKAKPHPWGHFKPSKDVAVSSVITEQGSKKSLDFRLSSYKKSNWMKSYLDEIRIGKRYVPAPGYLAFRQGIAAGLVPSEPGVVTDVETNQLRRGAPNVDISKDDWFLLEVNRRDMETTLAKVKAL